MADKKCDPNDPSFDPSCVSVDDLTVEAKALYAEVKDDIQKVGGEIADLAANVKCMIECTGQKALDAFKSIWAAAKS